MKAIDSLTCKSKSSTFTILLQNRKLPKQNVKLPSYSTEMPFGPQNLQCSLSIHFDKSYTNPILFSHIFINSHHIWLLVCTWHNLQWPVKLLVVEGYRSSSRKLLQCRREYGNGVHAYVPEVRVKPRSQELWDSNSISCSIVLLPLKVNSNSSSICMMKHDVFLLQTHWLPHRSRLLHQLTIWSGRHFS